MKKKRTATKAKSSKSLARVKQRAVKLFVIIGLISTTALIVAGSIALRDVFQPIQTSASTEHTESINLQERKFFILFVNEQNITTSIHLVKINTEENKLTEITLPKDLILRLPYGLESFKLHSLYKLAQDSTSKTASTIINQSLIEYFGVSAENVFIINQEQPANLADWLSNPTTLFKLAVDDNWTEQTVMANVSRWDLFQLYQQIESIPPQNRNVIAIEQTDIVSSKKGVDGTTEIITDQNKLDVFVKKNFQTDNILEENATIVVENASDTPLLATRVARYLSNMGSSVVEITNGNTTQETTVIYLSSEQWKLSETTTHLKKSFPGAQIEVNQAQTTKSDITISLGKDYAKIVTGN